MSPLSARELNARREAEKQAAAGEAELSCVDLISPTMQALLDCAEDALDDCGRPVGRAFFAPGANVAYDDCCDGQLWVRLVNVFPSGRPFPAADSTQPCGILVLAAQLAVGVVRCAHTIDDNGNPPTPDELTGDALGMTLDASILLSAIQCCKLPTPADQLIRVGTWTPLGVEGGCAGGEWSLTAGLKTCGCG